MYDKIDSSELHISQGDTERALLKAAGVAPGKENRAELFRAQISIAVFVEEAVENLDDHRHYLYLHLIREPMIIIFIFMLLENLNDVGVDLPPDDPVGDLDELVAGHALLLGIEEKHRAFKVSPAKENIVEGFETLKCDSF